MAQQLTYKCLSCGTTHKFAKKDEIVCNKKNSFKRCTKYHELKDKDIPPKCPDCNLKDTMKFQNKWVLSEMTKLKIKQRLQDNRSYVKCFRPEYNITEMFKRELKNKTHGEQTNHVIIFITGETGTYKSSISQEVAKITDEKFKVEKITFTNEELLGIIKEKAIVTKIGHEIPQTFVRDETPTSLKARAEIEFQNLSETMRDSRISLVLIKPKMLSIATAHYVIETICISEDNQKVKVAILEPKTNQYLGWAIFEIEIHNYCNKCKNIIRKPEIRKCQTCKTKLTTNMIWLEYMNKKKEFQKQIAQRKVGKMEYEKYAKDVIQEPYFNDNCIAEKQGKLVVKKKYLAKFLRTKLPNLTNIERDDILIEIEDIISKQNHEAIEE